MKTKTFVFGKAVGIQFLLEVGKKVIKHWAEEYEKELAEKEYQQKISKIKKMRSLTI